MTTLYLLTQKAVSRCTFYSAEPMQCSINSISSTLRRTNEAKNWLLRLRGFPVSTEIVKYNLLSEQTREREEYIKLNLS